MLFLIPLQLSKCVVHSDTAANWFDLCLKRLFFIISIITIYCGLSTSILKPVPLARHGSFVLSRRKVIFCFKKPLPDFSFFFAESALSCTKKDPQNGPEDSGFRTAGRSLGFQKLRFRLLPEPYSTMMLLPVISAGTGRPM